LISRGAHMKKFSETFTNCGDKRLKQAYLDSAVWIAIAEGIPSYQESVRNEMKLLEEDGWQFCYSDLVSLEVKIKPNQQNRHDLLVKYDKLFSEAINFAPFDNIFQNALLHAKKDGLKAMDAIHVAIAVKYDCELFVTTDPDFRTLKSIPLHWIDLSQTALH